MVSPLDYGKRILVKRLLKALEEAGFRIEEAPDYGGFVVSERREEHNMFLLSHSLIEGFRKEHAGNAKGFVEAVVQHIKSNITGASSIVPPAGSSEGQPVAEEIPQPPPPLESGYLPQEGQMHRELSGEKHQTVIGERSNSEITEEFDTDDVEELGSILPGDAGRDDESR